MNFFQLECFINAVEQGSFADVASKMHVTQPTITYQIANLEDELEVKLFTRDRRRVSVTRAGRVFFEDAKSILAQYHRSLEHFHHAMTLPDTVIRVGYTRYPDNYDIFSVIHKYRAQNPDIIIDVKQDSLVTEELADDCPFCDILLHYRYTENSFSNYSFSHLGFCPYYVIVSENSPLVGKKALTLEELAGQKALLINEYKNSIFQVPSIPTLRKAGIEIVLFEDMDHLMYAIADGVGFGIYPAKYQTARPGFVRIPLVSEAPLEYGLLYHPKHTAAVEAFLQYLLESLKDP